MGRSAEWAHWTVFIRIAGITAWFTGLLVGTITPRLRPIPNMTIPLLPHNRGLLLLVVTGIVCHSMLVTLNNCSVKLANVSTRCSSHPQGAKCEINGGSYRCDSCACVSVRPGAELEVPTWLASAPPSSFFVVESSSLVIHSPRRGWVCC